MRRDAHITRTATLGLTVLLARYLVPYFGPEQGAFLILSNQCEAKDKAMDIIADYTEADPGPGRLGGLSYGNRRMRGAFLPHPSLLGRFCLPWATVLVGAKSIKRDQGPAQSVDW